MPFSASGKAFEVVQMHMLASGDVGQRDANRLAVFDGLLARRDGRQCKFVPACDVGAQRGGGAIRNVG